MADKGVIYMNINALSKYIISFLFAVLVVLSVLLTIVHVENKALNKANAVLKEQVALRDTAINEIDKNIKSLQQQVLEAESICNERLKARNDVVNFLHINPPHFAQGSSGVTTPSANNKQVVEYEVVSKNKSDYAVNSNNWAGNSKAVPRPNHPRFKGQVPQKCDSASLELNNKVISYEKSSYAINSINSYWVQFTHAGSSKK